MRKGSNIAVALSLAVALALTGRSLRAAESSHPAPDGKAHQLELRDEQFMVDGKPLRVLAGEMHLARIPAEFWEDRIEKCKAMGLNTISAYVFWNEIEPKEGEFNFKGMNDVRRFVELCQKHGMWVVLRVGVYDCAEWEFGGYPAWLLKYPNLKVRSDDPQFLKFATEYVDQLGKQVGDLQVNHGGPILMTQFENEYGRIDPYLYKLKDIFVKAGFDGQLFTCDHSGGVWKVEQGIPEVLRGYNGIRKASASRIGDARKVNHGMPVYSPEVYTGWFDLWGKKHATVSIQQQVSDAQFLFDQKNVSWCYYMIDGGTNFGWMAGSNAGRPMQTSYDYDAPIDELGRITPKYRALRKVFEKNTGEKLPPIPADPRVIAIPSFALEPEGTLLSHAEGLKAIESTDVKSMEEIDQNYGFVLYKKKFAGGINGELTLPVVRDYAWIMVDGQVVGEGMTQPPGRNGPKGTETVSVKVAHAGACELEILVHNLGRTSSPVDQAHSRKGLIEDPTLDGKTLRGWEIVSLPLDDPAQLPEASGKGAKELTGPALFRGTFDLKQTGETYLDMTKWPFGAVWVNGHNLGRFWDVGSSRCLYLPSVWEKAGKNEVVVLDLGRPPADARISGVKEMIQIAPQAFHPYWVKGSMALDRPGAVPNE